ncbi:MAG: hypothetical protein C0467_23760 [Planctomycetaceae bacterium]|nr:hypothetical protein [Planctomycetaceae bacterium]
MLGIEQTVDLQTENANTSGIHACVLRGLVSYPPKNAQAGFLGKINQRNVLQPVAPNEMCPMLA